MRTNIIYTLLLGLVLGFTGCTDDFEEMDRPKTTSDKIQPDYLFTRALVTGSGLSVGVWQLVHQTAGSVYAQHWANINPSFTSDNYEPGPGNVVWDWYYARPHFAPLNVNNQTIGLAVELENPIKEACARIWQVYMYQLLTDMYGDIPYTEALETVKPAYDSQESVYNSLFEELEASVALIKENRDKGYPGYGNADVLYNGNLDQWIKFANTLGMRMALRVSDADENLTRSFFEGLDLSETMTSAEDMALVIPDEDGPTYHVKNPLSYVYNWHEVRISENLMGHMQSANDPRISVFAEPNTNGEFVGLRNGQPQDSLSLKYNNYYKPEFCNIGSFFTQPETPHYLITYAEACFLKAEAAERGFIGGDPAGFYRQAIEASLHQFEINDQQVIDDFYSEVAYQSATGLEQIYTQRWIALYPNGQEAWSLVRRTGFPQMQEPVYTWPGNDEMPRRVPYPVNERRYNAENYDAAVSQMGGDSQYTRMWWDVEN